MTTSLETDIIHALTAPHGSIGARGGGATGSGTPEPGEDVARGGRAPRPASGEEDLPGPAAAPTPRRVVAVVVEWREHMLLLKRSRQVTHDCGKWHCVTGYVEAGRHPVQQAIDELHEETGLRLVDLTGLTEGPVLSLTDGDGQAWPVHTFRAQTLQRRLTLNWEHTAYRWVRPGRLGRFDGRVSWLKDVVEAIDATTGESAG